MEQAWDLVIKNYEDVKSLCLDNYQANLNVKRTLSLLLPRVGLEASLTYSNATKSIDHSRFVPTSLRAGSLQVSQPIVDFRFRPAYLSSRFDHQSVCQQSEYELYEILYITSETYLAVLQSKQLLEVSVNQLKLVQEHYEVTRRLYENGQVPLTDLLRTEEEIHRAHRILFDVENNVRINLQQLTNFIGCDAMLMELLPPEFSSWEQEEDLESLVCEGWKRRQDLKSVGLAVEANKYRIQALCRERWPKLSFGGEYILASPETLGLRNNSWSAALWVTMPIFDAGENRLNVKEAKAVLSKTELLFSRMIKDLKVQITRTYLELLSSKQNYQLLEKEEALSQENYKIISERYLQGQATHIDLMDVLQSYIAAQANHVNAHYNLTLLQLKLKKDMGFFDDLLKHYDIDFRGCS